MVTIQYIKEVSNAYGGIKSPRLKNLANFINSNSRKFEATIEKGYCSTDRQYNKLRIPGKGRIGNKLIVRNKTTREIVYEHNSAETYRYNYQVCDWIVKNLSKSN